MKNNKIRHIALPEEHGSWGFVLEPLVLALVIGYSQQGLFLASASFLLFLAHQPIRIILNKKKILSLRKKAGGVLLIYLTLAVLLFGLVYQSAVHYLLYPFLLAFLLMGGFLLFELSGKARKITSEIIATVSIGFIAVSIVLLSGWSEVKGWAFFILLLNRAVPTVLFIHERIKVVRQQKMNKWIPVTVALIGFATALYLAMQSLIPQLALLGIVILIARIIIGFTEPLLKLTLKQAGILEFIYGILFVIISAVAYLD
jgi:hypothetical protein